MFFIKRIDGRYAAKPGRRNSYTSSIAHAQKFKTMEEAQRSRCPENEYIVEAEPVILAAIHNMRR